MGLNELPPLVVVRCLATTRRWIVAAPAAYTAATMAQSARAHDPLRLDVERFARDGGELQGEWPLAGMTRLADCCHPESRPRPGDSVAWEARGESRRAGGETQPWLHLDLRARLKLTCQRCLGEVETPLAVAGRFRFVAGEALAAELDAEAEEDVLALSRNLDLHALAEDELLLALPIVPRHEVCPEPLRLPASDTIAEVPDGAPSPFAVLAGLKRPPRH